MDINGKEWIKVNLMGIFPGHDVRVQLDGYMLRIDHQLTQLAQDVRRTLRGHFRF